ncbi:LVIVD repeat-containing protein [Haloarchaeobius sp. TZWWS8]|uniref:LVIVD repeat-containing protein n=1 Tax=Haloarchaeobius sp. TZWWS8 TaxID=3446121 RepID=UPI003EBABB9B
MERTPLVGRRSLLRAGAGALALPTLGGLATATGANYGPLDSLEIEGTAEAVVNGDGTVAYVAVGTGFVTVDIADPSDISVLAERRNLTDSEGDAIEQVLDVKYDDGQLLVPTAAQGGGPRGFYLYDVSDPESPEQIGDWFATPNHGNHNSHLEDGVAYLTGGYKLDIVDVSSDPFERLATWEPADWNDEWERPPLTVLHDLYVQDGTAYCAYWDGGTFMVDVSDPANPSFVGRKKTYTREELEEFPGSEYLEPGGNDHYVTVNDDASILIEGGESWDTDPEDDHGGPSGLELFDVTDPSDPKPISTIEPPHAENETYNTGTWTTAHNFEMRGDRLYTSWYQGGVTIHDVSDPANPERIAWWADPTYGFWTARSAVPGEFFVASSHLAGTATTPGLLTFPDRAGEMADPPSSVWWGAKQTTETETTTTTATTGEATETPTETVVTHSETGTTSAESDGGSTAGTPGFGVLTALAGLGLGAARYRGRQGEE